MICTELRNNNNTDDGANHHAMDKFGSCPVETLAVVDESFSLFGRFGLSADRCSLAGSTGGSNLRLGPKGGFLLI